MCKESGKNQATFQSFRTEMLLFLVRITAYQCCGSGSGIIVPDPDQQEVKEQINKTEVWTVCTVG